MHRSKEMDIASFLRGLAPRVEPELPAQAEVFDDHLKSGHLRPRHAHTGGGAEPWKVKTLKDQLDKGTIVPKTQLIRIVGTLVPRLLLAQGWWNRRIDSQHLAAWQEGNGLQKWLFLGFQEWGPSWDLNMEEAPELWGQLASGDESESLCVVLHGELAKKVKANGFLEPWGGCEVEITGTLALRNSDLAPEYANSHDCCVVADSSKDNRHKVERLKTPTETYTGYLWQCVAPKKWIPTKQPIASLSLDRVFFIWEHTEFTAQEARDYNLRSLEQKYDYLANKKYDYLPNESNADRPEEDGLLLIQKSDKFINFGGEPEYATKDFLAFWEREFR